MTYLRRFQSFARGRNFNIGFTIFQLYHWLLLQNVNVQLSQCNCYCFNSFILLTEGIKLYALLVSQLKTCLYYREVTIQYGNFKFIKNKPKIMNTRCLWTFSSHKSSQTLKKIFFQHSKINQKLAAIQGMFIQGKWFNNFVMDFVVSVSPLFSDV